MPTNTFWRTGGFVFLGLFVILIFFFLAPFFRKVSVLDCCTGQSPGNEMTVLLVSLQATRGGVAKSKPCSLRRGWGLAGGSGLTWHVDEDFAAWWVHVVVGGRVVA